MCNEHVGEEFAGQVVRPESMFSGMFRCLSESSDIHVVHHTIVNENKWLG